jgi:hypothetical protein
MLALRELQMCFAAALLDGAVDTARSHVVSDGVDAGERLDIYRNNVVEGYIKALAIGFPVIERLVGTEYFRQLAIAFWRAHPSRAGDLHHIGRPFADFLHARFDTTEYAYLPDVAALEWAYQEAQLAADAQPITAEVFRDVPAEQVDSLRFVMHPAAALIRSDYPIVRIWLANQPGAEEGEPIDLRSGPDHVLVRRGSADIEYVRLSAAEFVAFASLSRGDALLTALEAALSEDPSFDLGVALARAIQLGLFVEGIRS